MINQRSGIFVLFTCWILMILLQYQLSASAQFNGVFRKGLKAQIDVTYGGSVFASWTVDSLLGCAILAEQNQKTLFRLTDVNRNGTGMFCEVFNDTVADPYKVTYPPTPLTTGNPILYSAVRTKMADSYHNVALPSFIPYSCNFTRPANTPSPYFGMVVGVRANKTGRPRAMYDFKCRDVYDEYLQVDFAPSSSWYHHTEYAGERCPENYIVSGIDSFYDSGVQHVILCHPLLPPATVSATDCYDIDLQNTTAMEDPSLTLSATQTWPAECGNGTGDYVLASMTSMYNGMQYEVEGMTCCRLTVG